MLLKLKTSPLFIVVDIIMTTIVTVSDNIMIVIRTALSKKLTGS